ncbi:DNA (cytosine-5-)-methyltransferase [Thermosynechococcus sp. QKsg1]|nr:DNA (cytosine-5-)-methyltransferase [Thermosynechococcus sp. QKsg1]
MRLGFSQAGGCCVFSSEWNKFAQITYEANFGEVPAGDITQIPSERIPDHDILLAGFPCQPFSIAGVSKHNALGINHGFQHPTQGNLFFEIAQKC